MEKYETDFKLKVVKSFMAGEGGAKLLAEVMRQAAQRSGEMRPTGRGR